MTFKRTRWNPPKSRFPSSMASDSISVSRNLNHFSSSLISAQTIYKILQSRKPTRIVVLIRNKGHVWSSAPEMIVNAAMSTLHVELSEGQYKFLIREKWPYLDIIVFDVHHDTYEISVAHIPSELPVILVNFGSKGAWASMAPSFRCDQVNLSVAKHHNLNGWECQPPFYADYTSPRPPSY